MVLLGYSGARGTVFYEKNLRSKISCQTPFNLPVGRDVAFVRFSDNPVLEILDILVRIQITGSVLLTNRSGSRGGNTTPLPALATWAR
jgi:hypothetical protein